MRFGLIERKSRTSARPGLRSRRGAATDRLLALARPGRASSSPRSSARRFWRETWKHRVAVTGSRKCSRAKRRNSARQTSSYWPRRSRRGGNDNPRRHDGHPAPGASWWCRIRSTTGHLPGSRRRTSPYVTATLPRADRARTPESGRLGRTRRHPYRASLRMLLSIAQAGARVGFMRSTCAGRRVGAEFQRDSHRLRRAPLIRV
jgi:hypothetical protein